MSERRIIIDNDGGDAFYCKGSAYEQFIASRLEGLPEVGATTVFYTTVSSGFSVFTHNTKIGSVRTLHEERHPINIVPELMAKGTDCLEYVSRFCRENGLELFWGMRMNDTHDGTGAFYSDASFQCNAFKKEYPECLLGAPDRPLKHGAWSAVDYAHPLVRELAYRFIEEVILGYDIDGVHLDFFRHPVFFAEPAAGEHATREQLDMMTALMGRVASLSHSKGLKVSVRVPDDATYAAFLGLDIRRWLSEGYVDLLCTASYLQLNDFAYAARLGHEYGVPVYPSLDEPRVREETANALRAEQAGMRARCANAFSQGADGVLFFNYIFDGVKNREEMNRRREVIEDAARPERISGKGRANFASFLGYGSVAGGAPSHKDYQNICTLTPTTPLEIGEYLEVPIYVGDASGAGELRVWLSDGEGCEGELNGQRFALKSGENRLSLSRVERGTNLLRLRAKGAGKLLDAEIYMEGVKR